MNKIIKIDTANTDLGKIFADIDQTESKEIRIIYDSEINNLFSSNDITLIEDYAKKQGKEVKFLNSEKVEKSGFVIGSDVNEKPVTQNSNNPITNKKPMKLNANMPKVKFGAVLLVILLVISAFFAAGFYFFNKSYPKAQVFLDIKSQVYTGTQDTRIILDQENVDTQTDSIPGKTISAEANQEIIVIPTGEKEIGEKAAGQLKIYNKTSDDKTIKKGTEVSISAESDKQYIFYTTEEVKVDKKTVEETVTDTAGEIKKADVYGSAKLKIEASEIGADFNIDKDKVKSIKVGDYDKDGEITAEIDTTPVGGDSKKVTVVNQKDLDDLKDKLTEKAKGKAEDNLKQKVEEGFEILQGALDVNVTSLTYDKKADEEAEKIIGNITIKATTLTYKSADLREVLADKVKGLVPGNFSVVAGNDNLIVTSSSKELKYNETTGVLESIVVSNKVQSSVAPKIKAEDIAADIAGKQIEDAQKYLSEIANITGAKIVISPNIPIFNKHLPNKNKIDVEISITDGTE